jgi:vacuolar protein sorting-associated protein 29
MSQFGELVLIIGDFHIPMRAVDIPDKFKELLVPGKIQQVISTGNAGNRETLDWLRTLCSDVHAVRGDFDSSELPESSNFTIGSWKIGVIHGH